MSVFIDLTGKRFGRLFVVKLSQERTNGGHLKWECLCDCGVVGVFEGSCLRRDTTKSCGCLYRESIGNRNRTHGQCNKRTDEYTAWESMKQRCYNKKSGRYLGWGGRGITVCDEWLNSFETFFADMGKKPTPQHSLDRIDNDKGYSKDNCRWATKKEQNSNTRKNVYITYNNCTFIQNEVAEMTGVCSQTIANHRRNGDLDEWLKNQLSQVQGV